MNRTSHKLLRMFLIVLMMLAPLRGVLAMQLMGCDMKASAKTVVTTEHCRHSKEDAPAVDKAEHARMGGSCCADGGNCMSKCHINVSFPPLVLGAGYTPVFRYSEVFAAYSSTLIVRELAPPSRPPLSL